MRKSHEIRRDAENLAVRSRGPRQTKPTRGRKGRPREHSAAQLSHSDHEKRAMSPYNTFLKQEAIPESGLTGSGVLHTQLMVARPYPTSQRKSPSQNGDASVCAKLRSQAPACVYQHDHVAAGISSPSINIASGLRVDPFQEYPITFKEYFPQAVDYVRQFIAPGPAYLRLVMTNDVLFEAVLTFSLTTYLNQTPQLRKAADFHYGATLSKVNKSLWSSGSTRYAVEAAICNLAGISVGDLPALVKVTLLTTIPTGLPR